MGVKNLEQNFIQVYPNPTKNRLFVKLEDRIAENGSIKAYNLQGKLILHQFIKNEASVELNLEPFVGGVYYLKVRINNQIITQNQSLIYPPKDLL